MLNNILSNNYGSITIIILINFLITGFRVDNDNDINQLFDSQSKKENNKFMYFPFKYYKNYLYSTEIIIGSNNSKLSLIVDTGVDDIWIKESNNYNPNESISYINLNKFFKIALNNGYIEGYLGYDNIQINGLSLKTQNFYQIKNTTDNLLDDYDGILGLNLGNLLNNKNGLLHKFSDGNVLDNNLFSIINDKENSFIDFGNIPSQIINNKINYFKLESDKYWKIKIDKILINGIDHNICNNCYGILDTGSSIISGPSNKVYSFIEKLNINLNCDNYNLLPPVSFIINGIEFQLLKNDYLIFKTDEDNIMKKCLGGFTAYDIINNNDTWILGVIFIKKFNIVFDFGNKRLGISKINEEKSLKINVK